MESRPTSPLPPDHAQKLTEFIDALPAERESAASELDVLRSIYGDDAIRIWQASTDTGVAISRALRYEVDTNLPSYENIRIKVLVSLPSSYPSTSPPQLQLLSRYIGAFSVSPELFGDVLKTFMSSKSSVEFSPDTVAVFDGLQHVVEVCSSWYTNRLSAGKAGELVREEEKNRHQNITDNCLPTSKSTTSLVAVQEPLEIPLAMPTGVELIEAEPILDRKSVFIGRACRITHPSQVSSILSYLKADRRIARAAHPVINAWRCSVDDVMHQDNDDDGETAAGGRLAHLLQILELDGVLVIVTRFFGGIHLGPDRFKHINQAARSALEVGRFLEVEDRSKSNLRPKMRP